MTWGLVLSGGAAYGLANAGVIDVLERESLRPDSVAGSSMGAIAGALYAYTGSGAVLGELTKNLTMWNVAGLSDHPLKSGLHGGMFRQQLEHHLFDVLGDATIGDCQIPFICIAGRVLQPIDWKRIIRPGFMAYLRTCVEPYVFPAETRLIDAAMASSAIPVVFSPVTIGNDTFVDLVHFGAIPARTLKEIHHPDIIIATDTTPRYDMLKKALPTSWKEFLEEGYKELDVSRAACDVLIRPDATAAVFRFDKAMAFAEAGRTAALEALPAIKQLLAR